MYTSRLKRFGLAVAALVGLTVPQADGQAESPAEPEAAAAVSPEPETVAAVSPVWLQVLDNEYYKLSLNVRARMELADFDAGLDPSEAYTVRIRAGIGNKPIYGFSVYGELENINTFDESEYFNSVETPTGQSAIADPEETELNQLFLRYEKGAHHATVGRQRILLDDQRFVGNVGWRQNEQTFDAVWAESSLGLEGLNVGYGYFADIRRPFGDDGGPGSQDFDSDSHLVNVSYAGCECAKFTAFAYLLDFDDDAPVDSSSSFGLRIAGSRTLGDTPWSFGYAGSYAHQIDAADNPADYNANYVAGDGSVGYDGFGKLGLGYELLGSDDGDARFVTPLATGHKFNGYADAFLDNGGVDGLQDLYVYVSPVLPWNLQGSVTYHRFWSDDGGNHLGSEWDGVIKWPVWKHVTLLTKGAYFEGTSRGPTDRWRYWLEINFSF